MSSCGSKSTEDAAVRCLVEELGVRPIGLKKAFTFVYRADVVPNLVEHELDHVFVGSYEGEPTPAPVEVSAWRLDDLDAFGESTAGQWRAGRLPLWFAAATES